ncbi:calnexin-like protein [Iris pallida]|uniref:Calnexin-like protein n=1 Tax=Iris pallida TaxID=29817 RepID=A0AAX6FMS7_IRIPA|nr:calnexin-like protein [Iris pallida]KAJ6817670.1 calnexin-like protein [Iris pallida]KAJ6848866.1 calnexin-like protein [Iris pallida]
MNLPGYEIWLYDVSLGSTNLIQSTKIRNDGFMIGDPGPYVWVQYVPGKPIPKSLPNEGSVQGRKRKKCIGEKCIAAEMVLVTCLSLYCYGAKSWHDASFPNFGMGFL